ncbi:MAG: hypothetical protein AB7S78_09450 [Candidatus Omnitrophota bacterium]
MRISTQHGFTITELIMSVLVTGVLIFTIGLIYTTGTSIFENGYDRISNRTDAAQAIDQVTRYLVQAKSIDDISESSLSFTADMGSGDVNFRVYLYSPDDPEPNPPYSEDNYQIKFAEGDLSYGAGKVLVRNLISPVNFPFDRNNNLITLDWTLSRNDSTVRMRTNVRPRNL